MKEAILGALTMAAKHDAKMGNNLNQRVIGEKEDVVTQGDLEIGDLITHLLLSTKDRITVESEEHGKQTNLLEGEEERYYVAIDDIDGTNNLRVGKGFLPYCSMVVAFDGKDKTEEGYKYSDYSHAACLDYASGKIFYTEKGLGKVEDKKLKRYKHLYDRISEVLQFESFSPEDVKSLIEELSEVKISDEAIDYIHKTGNRFRQIVKLINKSEDFARANDLCLIGINDVKKFI